MSYLNLSGISPVEFKILVLIDETEVVTKGGIILTSDHKERADMAQVKGTLVAVGGNAFHDFMGTVPKPGDRIMIAKYAGLVAEGNDGRKYRIASDKDVAAVLS
jgi:co-chaperonin GroES (HSP10)